MATKVGALKTKKKPTARKAVPIHKEEASYLIDIRDIPPDKVLRAALICEVDDRKRWDEMSGGMVANQLPRIARVAASLMNTKPLCHFCSTKHEPMSKERMFHFSTDYKLCDCLMVLRKRNHDHIPGWNHPEKLKLILNQVMSGTLKSAAPVYQFVCRCGEGPVVVNAGLVAQSVLKFNAHNRKWQCDKCHLKHMREKLNPQQPMRASVSELIAVPKDGPEGKFNKRNRKKGRPGPQQGVVNPPEGVPTPMNALEKAPETPTA
jgi:hypothetical protein